MTEHCGNCESTIQKHCMVCDKAICMKCDTYSKHNGHKYFLYCDECMKFQCIKCKGNLETCLRCNKLFCVRCDDGEIETGYDGDMSFCRKHRNLNVNDLYSYLVKTYNEKLTLEEIRKKLLY